MQLKSIFCYSVFVLFILLTPEKTFAQFAFNKYYNVPVKDSAGLNYAFPWLGGLNNPQFAAADLNNDGIQDLVVFNRANVLNGDRLFTFINNGTPNQIDYLYAPEYEANFPVFETDSPRVEYWMLMEDFNCDGIADLFACTPGYIQLYLGKYDNDNKIAFEYKSFIQFKGFNGPLNVFVSSVDIPAIVDVNGDGDLDILTFALFGFTLEYYENLSQELTGTCGDTILFELREDCWGKFYESGLSKSVTFLDTCGTFGPKNGPRHAGSTVFGFDPDKDGDIDLLLGDIAFNNMNFLLNGGNADSAKIVWQDTIFPWYDVEVNVPTFPAAFYLDVNNDGRKDLIIAPNAPKRSLNYNCAWYYENTSSDITDTFRLNNELFMIDDMIDLGEGSYPVLADYDGDGLLDLFIGNYGYYVNGITYHSAIALFKNIGTAQSPSFQLITRDFMNLSSLGFGGMAPAFGDMDGDGDLDMFIGMESGEVAYFENVAGAGNPMNFTMIDAAYRGIDVGQYSAPFIFDVDDDGVLDLIIGRRNGTIHYHRNQGTASDMLFDRTPDNSYFGEVDVRVFQYITGFSAPVITTLDSTNNLYLVVGSESDGIKVYEFDRNNILGGAFTKVFERYSGIHEGERNSITIADLNNDGKMEMIVGTYRGGVSFFTQSDSIETPNSIAELSMPEIILNVFPNPTNGTITVIFNGVFVPTQSNIRITDMMGKTHFSEQLSSVSNGTQLQYNLSTFSRGIYMLEFISSGIQKVHKIIVY